MWLAVTQSMKFVIIRAMAAIQAACEAHVVELFTTADSIVSLTCKRRNSLASYAWWIARVRGST